MDAGTLLRTVRRRHGLISPTVETLARLLDLMGEELRLDAAKIDYGFDRTLFELNLAATPEQRIRRQASWSNGVRRIRDAARA